MATLQCGAADVVEQGDRMQLAEGLFKRGLFDLAAREYQALAEIPDVPQLDSVLFHLGECLRRQQRGGEAVAVYQRLVAQRPDSPHVPRAQLQLALLLLNSGDEALERAVASFDALAGESIPPEVRAAALYHGGVALEQSQRGAEALERYERLTKDFPSTDYAIYAALRQGHLLTKSEKPEDRARALGTYLDLAHNAKDPKVVEDAYYFAAQVALRLERNEESATLFRTLRAKFPNSARIGESALSAAWANYYAGHYRESGQWLKLLDGQSSHPQREEILYLSAMCMRQLERRSDAVTLYTQQLQEFPDGRYAPMVRFERIAVLYSDGKYQEVLAAGEEAGTVLPKYMDKTYWMVAEAAMSLSKTREAMQNYRLLVDKCPESPLVKTALFHLGWLLQKQEAWESAASWYHQVVERFPDDELAAKSLYASGVCRARLGQGDVALRDWTALLTKYPESPEVAETLYHKAMEELRAKNPRAAGATLDERMRRFPDDGRKAEVFYWRATVSHQTGEKAEAEKHFRACLAAAPAREFERMATLELGVLLQELGRNDEAAELFQTLLDAPITDKLGVDRLAWLSEFQLAQGRTEAAVKAAKALLALNPDKGWTQTAWTVLGRIHRARGERDPAINAFAQALETGASTVYGAEAALRLGELLTESGRFDEAATRLEEAARRAAAPEMLGIRGNAYMGLARNAEKRGDAAEALRYYMSVSVLFDDAKIVPEALLKAAALLEGKGAAQEAESLRAELRERYPNAAPAPASEADAGAPARMRRAPPASMYADSRRREGGEAV